jgi:hypothetical protein
MPYAQDATRRYFLKKLTNLFKYFRTHYKKLLRFIRSVDFLYNEAKFNLINESLEALTGRFERIYDNYINNIMDIPILISYCHPLKASIFYLPNPKDIKKSIFDNF